MSGTGSGDRGFLSSPSIFFARPWRGGDSRIALTPEKGFGSKSTGLIVFQEPFREWQSHTRQPGFCFAPRPCQKSPLPLFIKGEAVKKFNRGRQRPLSLPGPPNFPLPEFFHGFGELGRTLEKNWPNKISGPISRFFILTAQATNHRLFGQSRKTKFGLPSEFQED